MSSWVEVPGTRYALSLDRGRLVCRGSRGKILATLPRKARDSDTARSLFELRAFIEAHTRDCLAQAERWMLRAAPVPGEVIRALWPDPAWRRALGGAVVAPTDQSALVDQARAGLLMGVDEAGRPQVMTREGGLASLDASHLSFIHPLLIEHRESFAALAEREGISQSLDQLARLCVERPEGFEGAGVRLESYRGLRFEDRAHAREVCREVGCQLKGALMATCTLRESAQLVEARLWLGSDRGAPVTGALIWVDGEGRSMDRGSVGPVAWSEGHRMARRMWAVCGEPWGESDV